MNAVNILTVSTQIKICVLVVHVVIQNQKKHAIIMLHVSGIQLHHLVKINLVFICKLKTNLSAMM
jgi:hypothetical protein